ncbi:hypothetical protein RFI_36423, partial [Reticulomyxa filosa]
GENQAVHRVTILNSDNENETENDDSKEEILKAFDKYEHRDSIPQNPLTLSQKDAGGAWHLRLSSAARMIAEGQHLPQSSEGKASPRRQKEGVADQSQSHPKLDTTLDNEQMESVASVLAAAITPALIEHKLGVNIFMEDDNDDDVTMTILPSLRYQIQFNQPTKTRITITIAIIMIIIVIIVLIIIIIRIRIQQIANVSATKPQKPEDEGKQKSDPNKGGVKKEGPGSNGPESSTAGTRKRVVRSNHATESLAMANKIWQEVQNLEVASSMKKAIAEEAALQAQLYLMAKGYGKFEIISITIFIPITSTGTA